MVFSCTQFNVSSVLSGGRVALAVQLYDIEARKTDVAKFTLTFTDAGVAQRFYDHVKQMPDCINSSIPV